MKNNPFRQHVQSRGVALIITLGLLAVLTMLAVAFAIAMRVESMAARNYANQVRAKHLAQTALTHAMDDVNATCAGKVYPDWTAQSGTPDALGSGYGTSGADECDFLEGEATNAYARVMRLEAEAATAYWQDVVDSVTGTTNGRIAYLVVNGSGLLDANRIGGTDPSFRTDINEIDITGIIPSDNDFYDEREMHGRYETIQELYAINSAVDPYFVSNLNVMSFDMDRDVYFSLFDWDGDGTDDTNQIGTLNAPLHRKFYINKATNWFGNFTADPRPQNWNCYSGNASFMNQFYWPMYSLLVCGGLTDSAGGGGIPGGLQPPPGVSQNPSWSSPPAGAFDRPRDTVWHIINYLDPDRVPRSDNQYPWRHVEASEPIPLINEIVFMDDNASDTENKYKFKVELWYPFAPVDVTPADRFRLHVGVFTNNWAGRSAPNELDIMDHASPAWSINTPIDYMSYGSLATEFRIFETPEIQWPDNSPISEKPVWFLARVLKVDTYGSVTVTNPVDEAMGYDRNEERDQRRSRRALMKFDAAPVSYQVNDPRVNGQCRYWNPALESGSAPDAGMACGAGFAIPFDVPASPMLGQSLGTTNGLTIVGAWSSFKYQGLPIYATTNGFMENIAELGNIYRSNLDDETTYGYRFWRNIDLLNRNEGARLLDWITVRPTNVVRATTGLISINTRQRETLYHALYNSMIGWNNAAFPVGTKIENEAIWDLADKIIYNGPYLQLQQLFSGALYGGEVAEAFRNCAPDYLSRTNDFAQEGAYRNLVELISFRQNIFTVFVAAQSLGRNGRTVVGEQRGMANIIRDSYTGKYFVRNFKWLND